ncbi:hypothetical protein CLV58_11481 [Spirosoma oryzae]|uniref:Uncharacterized protein n=1 Tax=Spirosoma oryzae TaxID=1469603 RepID=A0A2T0SQ18_9BACT|nr:hypothetical protein [Spirosoma oryzae]PRY35496.1 hypothetical protein CLV58_11481 [Spirosoma oryzae]
MNRRIHPDDLGQSPYKEVIQTLTYQWVQATLPADELVYADYVRSVSTLLLTTQSPERTTTIVQAVLQQAIDLRKTAAWVDEELKFEGMLEGADRADFLLFELHQAGSPDDAQLDRYNERIKRFATRSE